MATPTSLPATFTSGQVLTAAQLNDLRGAFRILQVVSTTTTAAFTTSQAQNVQVEYTDIATTITPRETTSKILVIANLNLANGPDTVGSTFTLRRGSTDICIGDAAGSRARVSSQSLVFQNSTDSPTTSAAIFLDSPGTTSATTYRIMLHQMRSGTQTIFVNRSVTDPNGAGTQYYGARSASTLTLMEVSA